MKIEIWSDVICPWCGIGQARLDAALAAFGHPGEVEVVHRSFQLDPSFPVGKVVPVKEMLRAKYGMGTDQLHATMARVEATAASDGLVPYRVGENSVGNTQLVHVFLAFAAEKGLAHAAWKRAYVSYFGEGRSIFDADSLVALGVDLGLAEEDVRAALASPALHAKVANDGKEARALGCTGVPFVVIDRKYGISGAQPVATFRGALEKAWSERPAPLVVEGGDDASCGPDGCKVP